MKSKRTIALGLSLLAIWGLAAPSRCAAQYNPFELESGAENSRAMRGEFYLLGQYFHADPGVIQNVTLPVTPPPLPVYATSDLKFKMDDTARGGLGFGSIINSPFAVRAEFSWGYPDYEASFSDRTLRGESFVQEGRFNLDYHLIDGPVTPYISGGLGYFYLDTGIPTGPPGYDVWWDYWWGYIVTVSQPTYTDTFFTLNAAVGLRWDINESMFMKAEGSAEWIEMSGDWVQSLRATLALGFKF